MRFYPFSIHEYIRRKDYENQSDPHKLKIALDIAKGLAFLHEKQIIHRDLHSGNVLYDPTIGKVRPWFRIVISD